MLGSRVERYWMAVLMGPALSVGVQPTAGAQVRSQAALGRAIDSIVEAARRDRSIPGVSVAVVRGGDTIRLKGYGYANLESDVPATPQSVYQLASLSKQFTAVGILQLAERSKLQLDDDLTKYVPDYVTNGRRVTIHHLLTHTHGMQEYNRPETLREWSQPLTHERFLELMKDQPFDFPVGQRYLYRNSGYYFAGMIIEQMGGTEGSTGGGGGPITGKPYGQYLRENIFDPLGMTATTDCGTRPLIKHRAQGYVMEDGVVMNQMLLHMTWPFAVGSLCSSVVDLLAWQRALHGGEVLSSELYHQMITPATLNDGSRTEYGYGVGVSQFEGHPVIAHGGGTAGFSTYMAYYPDDRLTVIVLTNLASGNASQIHQDIVRAVLGLSKSAASEGGS